MSEIIAAIIGAVLAGIIGWFLSRKSRNEIEHIDLGNYRFQPPLPAKIHFEDGTLDSLNVKRLEFRNIGEEVIEHPAIELELKDDAGLLSVAGKVFPKRVKNTDLSVANESQTIRIEVDELFPYSLNKERIYLDIFSKSEAEILSVRGSGRMKDGRGWTVKKRDLTVHISMLGAAIYSKVLVPALLLYGAFFTSIVLTTGYMVWKIYGGLLSIDQTQLSLLSRDPVFLFLFMITAIVVAISLRMGWRGWILPIPIPFTGRILLISIIKKSGIELQ